MTFIRALSLLSFLPAAVVLAASPTVNLNGVMLVGRGIPTLQQEFFGGIPFAEPPIGKLRFRPPVPVASLKKCKKSVNGTFDATNYGLQCLQAGFDASGISEDCLTLNVLRPAGIPAGTLLPVMAWIYGGGFQSGTSNINGSGIVAESMIRGTPVLHVTLNYRIGPLGFPRGQEAGTRGDLNLGLKDQIVALQWIQKNIGLFGGDKQKVTIFGESAGSISIAILYLSPTLLPTLARAAILESGSTGSIAAFQPSDANVEKNWAAFVRGVPSCASQAGTGNTIPCLQEEKSSEVLLGAFLNATEQAGEQFPWTPIIDGAGGILPDVPSRLQAKGLFARIPFIAGTNLDEGTGFTSPYLAYTDDVITQEIIANYTPELLGPGSLERVADRLLELYPDVPALGSPFGTGNETFGAGPGYKRAAAATGDLIFQAPRRAWSQTASKAGVKTWGYLFADPQTLAPPVLGVYHSSEIVYVYGGVTAPALAKSLSDVMVDYWISFATSLDPNDGKGHPRPQWTQYTPKQQVIIQFNGQNTTVIPDDYRKEQIDFIMDNRLAFHQRRRAVKP